MNFFGKFLNIVFPIHCVNCRKKHNTNLCNECIRKIPFQRNNHKGMIFSAFSYKNPIVKKAIWALKFKKKKDIAKILTEKAFEIFIDEIHELELFNTFEKPILLPVPLHTKRLKERGFNQSILIAQILYQKNSSYFEINTTNVQKIRSTKPQAKIHSRTDRFINIKNCFYIQNISLIKNRNIIIIDDVTTTGATIHELRNLLLHHGAKQVYGFTLTQ